MALFDIKPRVATDAARHNENTYLSYDRSARKDVDAVRENLNTWFAHYPASERSELKRRFQTTFSSAYYELFLHELFRRQGFEIEIHPELPNTSKRPDFLLRKLKFECYVEAKEARDVTDGQQGHQNKVNTIYDAINKLPLRDYFLGIDELILKLPEQPSTKKLISFIHNEAAHYNPDALLDLMLTLGVDILPRIRYEDENLKMTLYLIPKESEFRTAEGPAIGAYLFETLWGSEESIKDSFSKKANRYGKLDKPYLVCINAIGIKGDGDFDIKNAIWGSLAYTWSTSNHRDVKMVREPDGIFLDLKGPRAVLVSAVLVTKVMEFNIHIAKHWFALHPYAQHALDCSQFDLSYAFVREQQVSVQKNKTIAEILDIASTWLDD